MKTMKKRLATLVIILATVTGILPMIPSAKISAASVFNKKLQLNTTYNQYDITGDRVADSIYITQKYKNYYDEYTGMTIYINNVGYDIPCPDSDWYYFDAYCRLIRLKNGRVFLQVTSSGMDEADLYQSLYQFTGSKMKNVLRLNKTIKKSLGYVGTDVTKVKDNTITVKYQAMLGKLANTKFNLKYKYKDGKFVLTSNIGEITDRKYKSVNKTFTWYTTKGCTKKKSSSLKKGTKAKPVQIYIKQNGFTFKIKTKDGKTGWMKGNKKLNTNEIIFKGEMYAG